MPEKPIGCGEIFLVSKPATGCFSIPAGVYRYPALSYVLAKDEPFSGVVVHIAANDVPGYESVPAGFSRFFTSLMDESDFGCHLADDEFLIIYPEPDASSANRRLRSILERLWIFQLSVAPVFPVLFSWGAVEAREARLLDAVTDATEKMLQTKGHRQSVYIVSARWKPAV
jgi:hypothetical protein